VVEDLASPDLATRAGVSEERVQRYAELGILSRPNPPYRTGDVNRVRLVEGLEQSGISAEDVGRAIASGEFSFAFVDALFPDATQSAMSELTVEEACARFGLRLEFVQKVYASLGLPRPQPSDLMRADDLDMAPVLQAYMNMPFSEDDMAYAARFWGENVHRLTKAETRFFATYVMAPLLQQGLSEQEMLDIAIPQGAIAQALDERVLLWLHRRHTEANLIQDVLEHIEAAIERAGAVRRRPRAAPAIGFLDLSGFTALTEAQGDEAAVQLSVRLDELVRDATHDHGGYPVKSLGDGVMCYFSSPGPAVHAALEMVEGADRAGLPPARVGLNTGSVIARDGDYFGRTVNVAARLAAHAGPGQVLVADSIVRVQPPDGVRFDPLGPVELKGVSEPVIVHLARRSTGPGPGGPRAGG